MEEWNAALQAKVASHQGQIVAAFHTTGVAAIVSTIGAILVGAAIVLLTVAILRAEEAEAVAAV